MYISGKKVVIFDFDVHHGNGTQEIAEKDPRILFISTHAEGIYPFTGDGDDTTADNVINIPLKVLSKPLNFKTAFKEKIKPSIVKFEPEFFFLSAGFDAHIKDPTHGLKLDLEDFIYITKKIRKLANRFAQGRIVSVLEGGYHIKSLKQCVQAHMLSLMKTPKNFCK